MTNHTQHKFFVKVATQRGLVKAYELSPNEISATPEPSQQVKTDNHKPNEGFDELAFESSINEFKSAMNLYLTFVPLTLSLSPVITSAVAKNELSILLIQMGKNGTICRPGMICRLQSLLYMNLMLFI
jgi:hypothetical protein